VEYEFRLASTAIGRTIPKAKELSMVSTVNGTLPVETKPTKIKIGRIGFAFFIAQLGFSVTTTAGGTLGQQLAAEISPADKVVVYSIAGTVGAVAAVIAAIVFGIVSDRIQKRFGTRMPIIVIGAILAALAFASTSLVQEAFGLIVAVAAFQFLLNASLGSVTALMPEYVVSEVLGRVSAASGLGVLLGQAFGGVAAGALLENVRLGYLVLPWIFPIGALILLALMRRMRPSTPPAVNDDAVIEHIAATPRRFGWIIGDSTFWWVFVGRALFILGLFMYVGFTVFISTDYLKLSVAEAGQLAGAGTLVFAFLAAIFIVITGPLSDRLQRRKPFVAGASVLLTVAAIPMVVAPSVVGLLLFSALAGAAFGSYIAVDQALMVDALPSTGSHARDLGILNAATTLPGVIAPAFAGTIVTNAGYPALFISIGVTGVLGALAMLGVRRLR
jgi:MFS family permease